MDEENFTFYGFSVGDMSVGIPMADFSLDTGMPLDCYDEQDKKNFRETHLSRTQIVKGFDKALKKFFRHNKRISAIQYYSFMLKYLIKDIQDNGNVVVYDNLINKEQGE